MKLEISSFFSQTEISEPLRAQAEALCNHLEKQYSLSTRPARRLTIQRDGHPITILPIVSLSENSPRFHKVEAGLSISPRGVVGCLVQLDERTAIKSARFLYVVKGEVVEGPAMNLGQVRAESAKRATVMTTADHQAGTTALYALRLLSSDDEARRVHPQLNFEDLFSAENSEFIETLAKYGLSLRNSPGIEAAVALPCCTTTCTTGCTCTGAVGTLAIDWSAQATSYWEIIHSDDLLMAENLLGDAS